MLQSISRKTFSFEIVKVNRIAFLIEITKVGIIKCFKLTPYLQIQTTTAATATAKQKYKNKNKNKNKNNTIQNKICVHIRTLECTATNVNKFIHCSVQFTHCVSL